MISIKNQEQIEKLREGGKILAGIMKELRNTIKLSLNTETLDRKAEELIRKAGGTPAFKNYGEKMGNPFPASICASFNDEVVHGIPSPRKILRSGDILKIDIGMKYKGLFTDMARTFTVGLVSQEVEDLISATEHSFWEGVKKMKDGARLSDYSKAVQSYVENLGFSVVRNLVGHGVGKELHEDPQIPNYYDRKYQDLTLQAGMVLALEPMVNMGEPETVVAKDGWTFKTKDGSLSAHYENTIVITKKGVEVLTV